VYLSLKIEIIVIILELGNQGSMANIPNALKRTEICNKKE